VGDQILNQFSKAGGEFRLNRYATGKKPEEMIKKRGARGESKHSVVDTGRMIFFRSKASDKRKNRWKMIFKSKVRKGKGSGGSVLSQGLGRGGAQKKKVQKKLVVIRRGEREEKKRRNPRN